MRDHKGRWITYREEAKIRLAGWGAVVRGLTVRMGPSVNVYSQQPFLNQRVDGDTQNDILDYDERLDKATEIDTWMNQLQSSSPQHYIAGVIVYVLFPWKHQYDRRLSEWQKETGLKKTRFYECVNNLEKEIAIRIQLSEES
jgi:hypothetical protein